MVTVSLKHQSVYLDDKDYKRIQSEFGETPAFSIVENKRTGKMYLIISRKDGNVSVARWLLGLKEDDDRVVIFRDKNGLNLQRKNLKAGTRSEAMAGKAASFSATSRYTGVSRFRNKWRADIRPGAGEATKYLGLFMEERDAAEAYNEAAVKYYGPNAKLNVLDDEPVPQAK